MRRSKIVATLGPASTSEAVIEQLIRAGMNVVRLNFSHGTTEQHSKTVHTIRAIEARLGCHIAIMGDLQGPKIRIARFQSAAVTLAENQAFRLSNSHPAAAGTASVVRLDYPQLVHDCAPGDELLLDDGRIVLLVEKIEADSVLTRVIRGGLLSDNKGINRRGGGLSAPSLTPKDIDDIKTMARLGLDYVAVSFPRRGADIEQARRLLEAAGSHAWLIAKIERAEAVADNAALDDIILASDGVMVARGDLGVEVGDARLAGIQKRIILHARTHNKLVITATQMMESMVNSPVPTRAEVSDVANAVLDYTDAVMLSAETAVGNYPVEAVKAMARICLGAEQEPGISRSGHRVGETFSRCDETIALAAMYAGNHFSNIKAAISLTETGRTPLIMSRIRSDLPIYCYTRHKATRRRVALFRGVYAMPFEQQQFESEQLASEAIALLKAQGRVQSGDRIIMTLGRKRSPAYITETDTLTLLAVP